MSPPVMDSAAWRPPDSDSAGEKKHKLKKIYPLLFPVYNFFSLSLDFFRLWFKWEEFPGSIYTSGVGPFITPRTIWYDDLNDRLSCDDS
jgi:hypothetical protein